MNRLPSTVEQLLQMHASFLHAVVQAVRNPALATDLQPMLSAAESRGWARMVSATRQILAGRRDRALLDGLDDEDKAIVEAILLGIDHPATLPALDAKPDATAAAPGLAALIQAAARGDPQAGPVLANMAREMQKADGDMARFAAVLHRLVGGERDEAVLARGMGPLGRKLLRDLIVRLGQPTLH